MGTEQAKETGFDQMKSLLFAALNDEGDEGKSARAKLAGMTAMGSAAVSEFAEFFGGNPEEAENVIDSDFDEDELYAEDMLNAQLSVVIETLLKGTGGKEIGMFQAGDDHGLVFVVHVPYDATAAEVKRAARSLRDVCEEEL